MIHLLAYGTPIPVSVVIAFNMTRKVNSKDVGNGWKIAVHREICECKIRNCLYFDKYMEEKLLRNVGKWSEGFIYMGSVNRENS